MALQVQELINKIKAEGIEEAQARAAEIERQAREGAEKIIEQAQAQAKQMLARAQEQSEKTKTSTHMALKQAGRDTLLQLRKKIEEMLRRVIAADVGRALDAGQLAGILSEGLKAAFAAGIDSSQVVISFSAEQAQKMSKGYLARLQEEIKKPIVFQSVNDIEAGFTISFDGGKSSFDFSDESLVAFLSDYVNPEVAALLKESLEE